MPELVVSLDPIALLPESRRPSQPDPAAAATLAGRPATDETWEAAAEAAIDEVALRTSKHRATISYREQMIRTILPQALAKSAERAQSGHAEPEGVGQ